MAVTRLATPCMGNTHMAHSKLHETCMLYVMTTHGPRKHIMGMHCSFLMAPHVATHVITVHTFVYTENHLALDVHVHYKEVTT